MRHSLIACRVSPVPQPMVNRKEHLESQLEQLEKAMEKLQKKHIHVYDDTDLW